MRRSIALTALFLILMIGEGVGKVIDLRNQTDADGVTREISYCGRPSPDTPKNLPGHAFVIFATINAQGQTKFRALGHTTFNVGAALVSYTGLLDADGAVVNERYTSARQECLTSTVNKKPFEAAYSTIIQPLQVAGILLDEDKPIGLSYQLGAEDCIGFMIGVARQFEAAGLKIPLRGPTELPLTYVRRMIDEN